MTNKISFYDDATQKFVDATSGAPPQGTAPSKFRVLLIRDVKVMEYQYVCIDVDAVTADEARRVAREMDEDGFLDWECDDSDTLEYYPTEIEEVRQYGPHGGLLT